MHVLTVACDQLINTIMYFFKQCKMKNTGNSGVGHWYIYYVLFLLRFLQIDNNIPYLLAAQTKSFFI